MSTRASIVPSSNTACGEEASRVSGVAVRVEERVNITLRVKEAFGDEVNHRAGSASAGTDVLFEGCCGETTTDHVALRIPLSTSPNLISSTPARFTFPPSTTHGPTLPPPIGLGVGLPLGSPGASTSMACQTTTLGTLMEVDEALVPERVWTPGRAIAGPHRLLGGNT